MEKEISAGRIGRRRKSVHVAQFQSCNYNGQLQANPCCGPCFTLQ